jgi:hypothetical protein
MAGPLVSTLKAYWLNGWHATCLHTWDRGGLLNTNRTKSPARNQPTERAPLLVLAQPSAETDDLLETLVKRPDLLLLRVTDLNAAELALRDVAVSLVLVCPETEAAWVTSILDKTDQLRPGTPVLALRPRSGDSLPAWKGRTIGVLRCPVLPDVLSRTVDVALGLASMSQATPRGR